VSADERDGDPDWFDLGITITVEGRDVPFADVFVALASGQSYLLLRDGAYFSLDKPELAALAALIEEARALTDRPGGEDLRISRFQAGLWDELAALGESAGKRGRGSSRSRDCCRPMASRGPTRRPTVRATLAALPA